MIQVAQVQVGSLVQRALLVRDAELRARREGGEVLKLTLADRSGSLPAIVLEGAAAARDVCRPGAIVFVAGTYRYDEPFGARLVVDAVRVAEGHEYERHELVDGPARPAALLESELRELIATVQSPHLRVLLERLLGPEGELWARFREAPAAKRYHEAYRHGLLEHSVCVAQAVSAISATFGGIDRDLAVCGAILHDIGKLDAYAVHGDAIEMTDEGRLFGEIALGYHRVRCAAEAIEGFPPGLAQGLIHIILSHHGSLEHGSPVVPATREATLVHMVDNLGARLGSFDRLQKGLPAGERWSAYDKSLGGGAFFGATSEAGVRAA